MTESAAGTPPTAKAAGWEDYVDIYYAPSRVFARRPEGAFWLPLLVLVVTITVLYFLTRDLLQPVMDAEFKRGMASAMKGNPQITPDQMESMRGKMATFGGIGIAFTMLISPLLTGLLLWLMGKVVGAKQALGAAMVVGVFAFYPRILQAAINGIQAFVMPESQLNSLYALSIGPARFFNAATTSPVTLALLGRFDLFVLWGTLLLAIGLRVTGKVTFAKALTAAALVWILGSLLPLFGALRQAMA